MMAQSGLEVIDTLSGKGTLVIDGRSIPVKYTLLVFQEMLHVSGEQRVPGLKSASGKFTDLKAADALKGVGRSSQLVLQDGKKSDVILTDVNGTFLVSGQI